VGREVAFDPLRDRAHARRSATRAAEAATAAESATTDEVVDLVVGDVRLELRESGRRVGAVETTERHHRVAGSELVTRCVLGAARRRAPPVPARARLQDLRAFGRRRRTVPEPAGTAAAGAGAAETAPRATEVGRCEVAEVGRREVPAAEAAESAPAAGE